LVSDGWMDGGEAGGEHEVKGYDAGIIPISLFGFLSLVYPFSFELSSFGKEIGNFVVEQRELIFGSDSYSSADGGGRLPLRYAAG